MKSIFRIAQPLTWIAFTYAICQVNLRSDDNSPLFWAVGFLALAVFSTWKSYR